MYEVFVSYARDDDRPLPGERLGWVTSFATEHLHSRLLSLVGRDQSTVWMDHRVPSGEGLDATLTDRLEAAAALIVVMSPAWLRSTTHCWSELARFVRSRRGLDGRVWVVEADPTDHGTWPPEIQPLVPIEMHSQSVADGVPARMGWPVAVAALDREYWNRVNRLAWQIKHRLDRRDHGPWADAPPTVWLADPAEVVADAWNQLADAVQQEQYLVSPAGPGAYFAVDGQSFVDAVRRDLAGARMLVQLLGKEPGRAALWNGMPLDHLQGNMADVAAGARKVPLLRWRPAGLELESIADAEHRRRLSGCVACSVHELRQTVLAQLARLSNQPAAGSEVPARPMRQGLNVGVTAYGRDRRLGEETAGILSKLSVHAELLPEPAPGATPGDRRLQLERGVADKDAVLAIQDSVPKTWVDGIVNDMQKTLAAKRRGRLWGGVLLTRQPKETPARKSGVHVLEVWNRRVDDALADFVQRLQGDAAGDARA